MEIQFFDDPQNQPRSREDVRIKQIGLFIQEDGRRLNFGLELTPFLEGPNIDVGITNADGELAGSLSVIEQDKANFSLMLHLRDQAPTNPYNLRVVIYYSTPESGRTKVDDQVVTFTTDQPGEHLFKY